MLCLVTFALAFNVPAQLGRRQVLQAASAVALTGAPLASYADGAASAATIAKAKAKYGQRVLALKGASAEAIAADANAIKLYVSAVTMPSGPRVAKESGIVAAGKTAVAAAKKGDTSGAQAAIATVARQAQRAHWTSTSTATSFTLRAHSPLLADDCARSMRCPSQIIQKTDLRPIPAYGTDANPIVGGSSAAGLSGTWGAILPL